MTLFRRKPQATYEEHKTKAIATLKLAQAEMRLRQAQEFAALNELQQVRYEAVQDKLAQRKLALAALHRSKKK